MSDGFEITRCSSSDRHLHTPIGALISLRSEERTLLSKVLLVPSSTVMVKHGGTVKAPMVEQPSMPSTILLSALT
jgi:hypothetical protein